MHFVDDRTRLPLIPAQLKQHRESIFYAVSKIFSHADVTSVRTIADELNDTHFIWRVTSNTKEPFIRLSRNARIDHVQYNTTLPFFFKFPIRRHRNRGAYEPHEPTWRNCGLIGLIALTN